MRQEAREHTVRARHAIPSADDDCTAQRIPRATLRLFFLPLLSRSSYKPNLHFPPSLPPVLNPNSPQLFAPRILHLLPRRNWIPLLISFGREHETIIVFLPSLLRLDSSFSFCSKNTMLRSSNSLRIFVSRTNKTKPSKASPDASQSPETLNPKTWNDQTKDHKNPKNLASP